MGRLTRAVNAAIDVCCWPLLGGAAGWATCFRVDRLMRWIRPDDVNYEPEGVA